MNKTENRHPDCRTDTAKENTAEDTHGSTDTQTYTHTHTHTHKAEAQTHRHTGQRHLDNKMGEEMA